MSSSTPLSFDYRDRPTVEVLAAVTRMAEASMVLDADLQTPISVAVKDADPREALDRVLEVAGVSVFTVDLPGTDHSPPLRVVPAPPEGFRTGLEAWLDRPDALVVPPPRGSELLPPWSALDSSPTPQVLTWIGQTHGVNLVSGIPLDGRVSMVCRDVPPVAMLHGVLLVKRIQAKVIGGSVGVGCAVIPPPPAEARSGLESFLEQLGEESLWQLTLGTEDYPLADALAAIAAQYRVGVVRLLGDDPPSDRVVTLSITGQHVLRALHGMLLACGVTAWPVPNPDGIPVPSALVVPAPATAEDPQILALEVPSTDPGLLADVEEGFRRAIGSDGAIHVLDRVVVTIGSRAQLDALAAELRAKKPDLALTRS